MLTRKTKILAKIADNRSDVDFLKSVFNAGADVAWMNTAHQDEVATFEVIKRIREISEFIPIAIDTKGPEVRTKDVETPIEVNKGDHIVFTGDFSVTGKNIIHVTYPNFHNEIPVGEVILYDDALIETKVVEKTSHGIKCIVNNPGVIKNKKSLNVPNVHIKLPALSEKDKGFIHFCAKNNVDYITHSFVRNEKDIAEIRKITNQYPKYNPKIIAKIENREGFTNIKKILKVCDGLMVARGDLGAEVGLENVPYMQFKMVETCLEMGKYCIVATQALESMIKNPRPTRAEVSDVANAVFEGTGAMSMSGETAYGSYPVEATTMMGKVMKAAEQKRAEVVLDKVKMTEASSVSKYVGTLVKKIEKEKVVAVCALGCDTKFLRSFSAHHLNIPVFAGSKDKEQIREMRMAYGIIPVYHDETADLSTFLSSLESDFGNNDKIMIVEPNKKSYKVSVKKYKEVK